ncbi:MAG: hypothetical protein V1766_15740 [Pseudomonadota bacterium]
MPNPLLTRDQREKLFRPLFTKIKSDLENASCGDLQVLWALRRKIAKELVYLERGTPAERRKLQNQKYSEQNGLCAICGEKLPERGGELDRFEAFGGYTTENTRMVCHDCHVADQKKKNYT